MSLDASWCNASQLHWWCRKCPVPCAMCFCCWIWETEWSSLIGSWESQCLSRFNTCLPVLSFGSTGCCQTDCYPFVSFESVRASFLLHKFTVCTTAPSILLMRNMLLTLWARSRLKKSHSHLRRGAIQARCNLSYSFEGGILDKISTVGSE